MDCVKFVNMKLRLEAHSAAEVCLKFKNMVVDEELGGKTWDEILEMEGKISQKNPCQKVKQTIMATPSKEKKCSTCHKMFSTKKILKRHNKIHSEEKTYQCSEQYCNLSFTRKDHLDRHMRKHSGEKPFSCDLCNEKFPYLKSLHRHMKNKVCTK